MDEQRKEWNESEEVNLPQETWDKVWSSIGRRRRSYGRVFLMKGIAAAASVVILVAAGINLWDNPQKPEQLSANVTTSFSEQKLLANTTQKTITVYLPDSSVVLLSPSSVIRYYAPFRDNMRDFYLEGEARFTVRKDKTMPFTVYAGELATTALGTEFTVTNNGADNNINIQLHSGKVVIRRSGALVKSWKKDVYLAPGEQLNYNTVNMTASVSLINEVRDRQQLGSERKQKRLLRELHNEELSFVNSPLPEVISRLEKQFKISIACDSTDMTKANFTGTFSRSDSLNIILKIISQMNDLEMQEENGGYVLKKIKTQQ